MLDDKQLKLWRLATHPATNDNEALSAMRKLGQVVNLDRLDGLEAVKERVRLRGLLLEATEKIQALELKLATMPRKIDWEMVRDIRERHATGYWSLSMLATTFKISKANVHNIVNHKTWKVDPL